MSRIVCRVASPKQEPSLRHESCMEVFLWTRRLSTVQPSKIFFFRLCCPRPRAPGSWETRPAWWSQRSKGVACLCSLVRLEGPNGAHRSTASFPWRFETQCDAPKSLFPPWERGTRTLELERCNRGAFRNPLHGHGSCR